MTNAENVEIRHFRDGDEAAINGSFNRIFGTSRSLDQWHWKFWRNPARLTAPSRIILGVAAGRIVAQYAMIARDLWLCGALRRATEAVDNCIDPDFRGGRNLQKDMIGYCGDLLLKEGNDFSYGCPNDIAYRVGKRVLGYQDLFVAPRLVRRLSLRLAICGRLPKGLRSLGEALDRLAALVTHLPLRLAGGGPYEAVDFGDPRLDALWERATQRFAVLGVRDSIYLRWRYGQRPDARFHMIAAGDHSGLKAWVVLHLAHKTDGTRIGYLMDFLYFNESDMVPLLKHGLLQLTRMGADFALALAAPGSAGERLLRTVGFRERPGFDPVRMVIRWFNMRDEVCQAVTLDPMNWHLCHGDLDLDL